MNHRQKLQLRALATSAVLALGALLAACGSESVTAVEPSIIAVSPEAETLFADETVQLTAVVRDANGNTLPDRAVEWSSADPDVAQVNANGLVEARGPGTTEIRASADGIVGTATITVRERPDIVLGETSVRFEREAGDSATAEREIEVTSSVEAEITDLTVAVSYAEGAGEGWLEATLAGTSTPTNLVIRASAAGLSQGSFDAEVRVASANAGNSPRTVEVRFDVEPVSVAAVVVSPGEATLQAGETVQLTAEVQDEDGNALSDRDVEWSSADTEIATVDDDGLVEARAAGETEIRASADGVTGTAAITVRDRPVIVLGETAVDFVTVEGRPAPAAQTVAITSEGEGGLTDLTVEVEYDDGAEGWLDAELDGTSTPAELTLALADEIPSAGTYEATVLIASPDASNSPASVTVALEVEPAASPETSTIEADPEQITADETSTSTITVTLYDAAGDQRTSGGDDVAVATTTGGLSSVTDNGDGTYTATLTATATAGTATVTATVNGETIEDQATVAFLAGQASPATSTLEADPDTIAGNGTATSTITVTILDEHGNLTVGGDAVELVVPQGGGSLSPVTDHEDGTYSATLTAPTVFVTQTVTITAKVNGLDIEDSAQVTYRGLLGSQTETASMPRSAADGMDRDIA